MYAIVNVVYGIPLNTNDWPSIGWSDGLEELLEEAHERDDSEGFFLPYSGAGDIQPAAFGIVIGKFDEGCHHVELSDVVLKPSSEEMEKFQDLWDELPAAAREEITTKFGEPRTFLLWSTS